MALGINKNTSNTVVVNNYFGGSAPAMGMGMQNPMQMMMQMMQSMMGLGGGPSQQCQGMMPPGMMPGGMPGFSPMMGNNIGNFLGNPMGGQQQMMQMMMMMMQMMQTMMGGGCPSMMGGMPGMMGGMPGGGFGMPGGGFGMPGGGSGAYAYAGPGGAGAGAYGPGGGSGAVAGPGGTGAGNIPTGNIPLGEKPPQGLNGIMSTFGPAGQNQTTVEMPAGPNGKMIKVTCHKKIAPKLQAVFQEIKAKGLSNNIKSFDGCYNNRSKRGGSSKSTHAWGIAVDINAGQHPMGKSSQTPGQKAIAEIFAKHGFKQLPNDPMHFQYCTGY